jgi:hypothetical protein
MRGFAAVGVDLVELGAPLPRLGNCFYFESRSTRFTLDGGNHGLAVWPGQVALITGHGLGLIERSAHEQPS